MVEAFQFLVTAVIGFGIVDSVVVPAVTYGVDLVKSVL
jgi:hypothetical protein